MWLQGRQTGFSEVVTVWVDFNATTQACFQNPVNPVRNNVAILEQTNCVKAFYSAESEDVLLQYRQLRPQLSAFELPSLLHFFETKAQPFPYHPNHGTKPNTSLFSHFTPRARQENPSP
jgi:hypothetical protein